MKIGITTFRDARTVSGTFREFEWADLRRLIERPEGKFLVNGRGDPDDRKKQLPLLRLARFAGDTREKGSPGPTEIYGLEGDYDAEKVPMHVAAEGLAMMGWTAQFYTTAKHTPGKPRWRVMVPLSGPAPIDHHPALVRRLDKALGDILGRESYDPQRCYFVGRLEGVAYETLHLDGKPMDVAVRPEEIAEAAAYLPARKNVPVPAGDAAEPSTDPLLRALETAGMLGRHNGGAEWNVMCPNGDEHSDGRGLGMDDSAVVYAYQGARYGFKCQHDHCAGPSPKCPEAKLVTLTDLINAVDAQDAISTYRAQATFGIAELVEPEDDLLDDRTLLSILPTMPDEALYGVIGTFAKSAAAISEASVQAVYVTALSRLSVAVAECFCVEVSHERVPLAVSSVLTGPSGKGRKGTAASLVEHGLMPEVEALAQYAAKTAEFVTRLQQNLQEEMQAEEQAAAGLRARLAGFQEGQPVPVPPTKERNDLRTAVERARADLPNHLDKPLGYKMRCKHLVKLEEALVEHEKLVQRAEVEAAEFARYTADPAGYAAEVQMLADMHDTRVRELFNELNSNDWPTLDPLHNIGKPPHILRGISSGEGLVAAIADPDQARDVEGTLDKRVLIDVSEFGAVLSVLSREGNTGSANLRDAIDGRDIATTGKVSPLHASQPHCALTGHITGAEFMRLTFGDKKSTEADNGLLNRMLFVFTARTKLVPLPGKVPGVEAMARTLWANLQRAFDALKPTGGIHATEVPFTPGGEAEWIQRYEDLTRLQGESREATALMQRAEWHARKLAALMAILNGEFAVSAEAVRAACALVTFVTDSINRIAADYEKRVAFGSVKYCGEKILTHLTPEFQRVRALRRATGLSSKEWGLGLRYLTEICSPPLAIVGTEEVPRGNNAKPQRLALVRRA